MFTKGGFDPVKAFWSKVNTGNSDACWEWKGAKFIQTGYGKVCRNYKSMYAHRLAYELTNGKTDKCVLHKCDNRLCCNPKHLFVGTRTDNMNDKVSKGRQMRGEMYSFHKLTDKDVIDIRQSSLTNSLLAQTYEVTQSVISRVKARKSWKHIP